MNAGFIFVSIALGVLLYSCQNDDANSEFNDYTSSNFPYEAEVIGVNSDCGLYAIKITHGLSEVESIVGTTLNDGVYIAKNLPRELELEGQKIRLDIRMPNSNELSACTHMGPTYNWLFVIRAKKI